MAPSGVCAEGAGSYLTIRAKHYKELYMANQGGDKKIVILVISVIAAICAIGWFNAWIARMALCMHLVVKNYTPPTDREMEAYIKEILRRTFSPKGRA